MNGSLFHPENRVGLSNHTQSQACPSLAKSPDQSFSHTLKQLSMNMLLNRLLGKDIFLNWHSLRKRIESVPLNERDF